MMSCDVAHSLFDIVTFDCYGTLVDWESGIVDAFEEAMERDGIRIEPRSADALERAA